MFIIKTNFQINDNFLNDLSHLINGEIKYISPWAGSDPLEKADNFYNILYMFFSVKSNYLTLGISSLFFYNENISDELSTLKISFEDYKNKNIRNAQHFFFDKEVFIVNKIKIYGEERIRIWSEIKKIDYFHKKVDFAVGDYYFNNKIIRFESVDDQQVNILVHRQGLELNFDKSLNLDNDFYLVSDLNMGEDFENDKIWTNVQRIKCHYEIDENGIKKHINEAIGRI
jgi:hypothetical protein